MLVLDIFIWNFILENSTVHSFIVKALIFVCGKLDGFLRNKNLLQYCPTDKVAFTNWPVDQLP